MNRALFAVLLLAAAVGGFIYLRSQPAPTMPVAIRLQAMAGAEPVELGRGSYPNPGGEGAFRIRDFQFFVSNIRLVADNGAFVDPDSYHLARFDSEDGTYVIELGEVPREEYTRLEFGIGVDPVANGTIVSVGDLDPNGRMAWTWEVGYKFVLFEGGLQLTDRSIPLVYHVGFDENYAEVTIPLDPESFQGDSIAIELCADVLRIFSGNETVDMSELSDVKFDRADARLLAQNYATMVSACPGG